MNPEEFASEAPRQNRLCTWLSENRDLIFGTLLGPTLVALVLTMGFFVLKSLAHALCDELGVLNRAADSPQVSAKK